MNYKTVLETLVRYQIPREEAVAHLESVQHGGTLRMVVPGEGGSKVRVLVDCNRGGMEDAYSISVE